MVIISKTRFFGSVQLKYALSYIVLIALTLGFLNIFPVIRLRDILFDSKITNLHDQASLLVSLLSPLTLLSSEDVGRVMDEIQSPTTTHILIANPNHEIVYDSNNKTLSEDYEIPQELVMSLVDQGKTVVKQDYSLGILDSVLAQPIIYRNEIIGALYLRQDSDSEAALIPALQDDLQNLSIAILLGSLTIAFVFSRLFAKRIMSLLKAIKAVHSGEFAYRVSVKGRDELSQLGSEFNSLAERLQRTEEMRLRFVSDASHELKTPLSGIRLLTDSIVQTENMDPTTIREFVGDIGSEAERLTRITERLLELTRLNNNPHIQYEIIDFKNIVSEALKMLTPMAAAKGVTLKSSFSEECFVLVESDVIYQAVFNIIENAIKYNTNGGQVVVKVTSDADNVVFISEDTGIGIPEKELPFIFERFYRVDKARASEVGGSGLGLSIVRDAAEKHGGTVIATRGSSGGSKFILTLPLYIQPSYGGID